MKKKLLVLLSAFLIVFVFSPVDDVSAATDSRRLDAVLGEYALSLVGKANSNMEATQKYIGEQLLDRFKNRTNELNSIVNGALSIEGGDEPPQTWDKIVDFVFPVEKPDVKLTSTPALKAAISDIIINMPDNIEIGGDYKYLGKFGAEYPYPWIKVPFSYDYIGGVSSDYVYFKFVELTKYGVEDDLLYAKGKYVNSGIPSVRSLKGIVREGKTVSGYADFTDDSNVKIDALELSTELFANGDEPAVDVYYSVGDPKTILYNKTDIINNSYLNKNNTTIYNILNGQYGDNTTVTHNFDNDYKQYSDYGVSPDKNKIDSGNSILSNLLDFISSIPKIIADLLKAIMELVEKIINIFIPTSEQIQGIGDSITLISDNFKGKFSTFIDLGNSLSGAFNKPSNIFDYRITLNGDSYPLIPSFLSSSLGQVRIFLSGALVLFTFTNIYKRIVGSGDVIKS